MDLTILLSSHKFKKHIESLYDRMQIKSRKLNWYLFVRMCKEILSLLKLFFPYDSGMFNEFRTMFLNTSNFSLSFKYYNDNAYFYK